MNIFWEQSSVILFSIVASHSCTVDILLNCSFIICNNINFEYYFILKQRSIYSICDYSPFTIDRSPSSLPIITIRSMLSFKMFFDKRIFQSRCHWFHLLCHISHVCKRFQHLAIIYCFLRRFSPSEGSVAAY